MRIPLHTKKDVLCLEGTLQVTLLSHSRNSKQPFGGYFINILGYFINISSPILSSTPVIHLSSRRNVLNFLINLWKQEENCLLDFLWRHLTNLNYIRNKYISGISPWIHIHQWDEINVKNISVLFFNF